MNDQWYCSVVLVSVDWSFHVSNLNRSGLCDWNVMQRCGVFKNSCCPLTHTFSVLVSCSSSVFAI